MSEIDLKEPVLNIKLHHHLFAAATLTKIQIMKIESLERFYVIKTGDWNLKGLFALSTLTSQTCIVTPIKK